ncbi:hypothetical protein [Streptomyces sp. WZ.A104]|nr:hypothetical protein [Streptomyces sp. WZ.A104]
MPAITETTETDKPEVIVSDTEIADAPGDNDATDSVVAEALGAYAVLMA